MTFNSKTPMIVVPFVVLLGIVWSSLSSHWFGPIVSLVSTLIGIAVIALVGRLIITSSETRALAEMHRRASSES